MGISADQWRAKIGLFQQKVHIHFGHSKSTGCNIRLACVIAFLLLIGGVEPNPGPTVAELSKRLDELIVQIQAMRDQLSALPVLSTKLDVAVTELYSLLDGTKETIKQHNLRLCALEKSIVTKASPDNSCGSNLDGRGNNHGNANAGANGNSAPESIERIVKTVLDRDRRKCNVVLFNLPDTNSFQDDKRNLSELMHDLELDESMIKSILRIGRPSSKVRPLRIQLSSESSRNTFLDAAYLLKFMRRKWPKLGISPDRTPDEMETHRSLMQEFRERRSQGENIHLAGDKIVQNTNKSHFQITQHKTAIATSRAPPTYNSLSTSSPLRVNLPPLTISTSSSDNACITTNSVPSSLASSSVNH